jgi:hypothetical protein
MPNLSYIITLTSEADNSGPYYNVTYTTGSIFYSVLSGTPAYLPNVGDTATVSIPSGPFSYLAFNLNNGIGGCELCDNNVVFVVTGSAPTSSCCTPTLDSVTPSGSFVNVAFTLPVSASCLSCSSVTIQTSTDGTTWGGNFSGTCTSPRAITAPTASCSEYTTYYRLYQTCTGSLTSSFSNTGSYFISASGNTCCTPTITSIALSGSTTSSLLVNYGVTSGTCCLTCSFVTLQTSSNGGASWGGAVTASCIGSQFIIAAPACSTTGSYRIQQTCSGSVTSSFSATSSFSNTCVTPGPVEYEIDNAASGDSATACSGATTTSPVWAEPENDTPIVGMFLYNESTLTTTFVGSPGWRKLVGPLGTYAIEIDTNGEITNKVDC